MGVPRRSLAIEPARPSRQTPDPWQCFPDRSCGASERAEDDRGAVIVPANLYVYGTRFGRALLLGETSITTGDGWVAHAVFWRGAGLVRDDRVHLELHQPLRID